MNLRHGRPGVFRAALTLTGIAPAAFATMLAVNATGCGQGANPDEAMVVPTQDQSASPAAPVSTSALVLPSNDPHDDHFASVLDQPVGPAGAGRLGRAAVIASATRLGHRRSIVAYSDRGPSASATDALAPVSLHFARSDDGGEQWQHGVLDALSTQTIALGDAVGEPTLAASRPQMVSASTSSTVYIASVATMRDADANERRAIVIARSADGGETFSTPDVAVAPTYFTPFGTADSPSLSVDDGGTVHLAFVSDQGTDRAVVQYWIGVSGPDACGASCMLWHQGPSPALHADDQAKLIRHPVIRTFRRGVYLSYELREDLTGVRAGEPDSQWGLMAARLNPLTYAWEPMAVAPAGDRWIKFHAHTAAVDGLAPADVDRVFDFGIDPIQGKGTFTWISSDGVSVRSFQIQHALAEEWGPAATLTGLNTGDGGVDATPSVAAEASVRAVSWFHQDPTTGRVRLLGAQSGDAGESFEPVRNLTPLTARPRDASMPVCGSESDPWRPLAATTLIPRGDNRLAALTVHFDTGTAACPAADAPAEDWVSTLAATRWRASDSQTAVVGRAFQP